MASWSFDLIGEMERMRREMDRLLGESRSPGWSFPFSRTSFLPGRAARGYPLVNLGEDKDNLYIDALAPGVDPKTLDISILQKQLTLSGEKRETLSSVESSAVHRSERSAGHFSRVIQLPADVVPDRVRASYQDGLLRLTLPKEEAAKPRQIEVRID